MSRLPFANQSKAKQSCSYPLYFAPILWMYFKVLFINIGTAITRPTENICGNSTCPKTPQNCFKEGQLKPFFANNVDIPFARARRLRPCPRKASARIDPGRKQWHTY